MYSVFIQMLLKVVSYYDLSVLSISVMGFQILFDGCGGWVGGVWSFNSVLFWIFGILLTL